MTRHPLLDPCARCVLSPDARADYCPNCIHGEGPSRHRGPFQVPEAPLEWTWGRWAVWGAVVGVVLVLVIRVLA